MKTFHFVSHYGLHLDSQKRSPNVYRGNEQAIIAPARFSGAWSGEEVEKVYDTAMDLEPLIT